MATTIPKITMTPEAEAGGSEEEGEDSIEEISNLENNNLVSKVRKVSPDSAMS